MRRYLSSLSSSSTTLAIGVRLGLLERIASLKLKLLLGNSQAMAVPINLCEKPLFLYIYV